MATGSVLASRQTERIQRTKYRQHYRERKPHLWWSTVLVSTVCLAYACIALVFKGGEEGAEDPAGRELLSEVHLIDPHCDRPFDEYMLIVYILAILYLFLGLAIVCDDYFVSSLEAISAALSLSDDVAGATFMAAGSSAPELFTSLVGTFLVSSSVGVGTIIGSAIFNILIIIGCTCLLSHEILDLDWRPLTRDSLYYALSIVLVGLFFGVTSPNEIDMVEALIFVLAYIGYVLTMKFNRQLMNAMAKCAGGPSVAPEVDADGKTPGGSAEEEWRKEDGKAEDAGPGEGHELHHHDQLAPSRPDDEVDQKSLRDKIQYALALPFGLMFKYSIPDCRDGEDSKGLEKWYPVTFTMSIVWIGIISFFMVEFAGKIGDCAYIPPVIMGLTVIAAGTSVPDALGSVLVARDGQGDMAIANALGSNIFDICFGLGLPWLIYTMCYKPGSTIKVGDPSDKINIVVYVIILFVVLFLTIGVFKSGNWKLNPKAGKIFLGAYAVYVVGILVVNFTVGGSGGDGH